MKEFDNGRYSMRGSIQIDKQGSGVQGIDKGTKGKKFKELIRRLQSLLY